jgi:hypothetical protein
MQRKFFPLVAIVASVGFATLVKAGAIDALGLVVASRTIHPIAQAQRELITIYRYVKEPGNSPLIVWPNRANLLLGAGDIVLIFMSRVPHGGARTTIERQSLPSQPPTQ